MDQDYLLLVEDDSNDEALTLRALGKTDMTTDVEIVRDGAEALAFLFGESEDGGPARSRFPTVVLLDLKLPRVSGLEVLKRVRADPRTRYLPVVVLTSSDEQRDLVKSYEYGCNSYVRKPVQPDEFTKAIRQLGLYWMLLNRPPAGAQEVE